MQYNAGHDKHNNRKPNMLERIEIPKLHKQAVQACGKPAKLAHELGIPVTRIYGWIKNDSIPTAYVRRVADMAGLDVNDLLFYAEKKKVRQG